MEFGICPRLSVIHKNDLFPYYNTESMVHLRILFCSVPYQEDVGIHGTLAALPPDTNRGSTTYVTGLVSTYEHREQWQPLRLVIAPHVPSDVAA
jgi:hypothetical protein